MSSSAPVRRGLLFVVSAPSGTGKTTVVERLVQVTPESGAVPVLHVAGVRAGEADGIDYNFITRTRFEEMVQADAFLEWADVFGNLYGTCAEDAERDCPRGGTWCSSSTCRAPGRCASGAPTPSASSCCRRRSRCSSGGSAAAARIPRRRCSAASRPPGTRSPPSCEYDYVVVNDELDACVDRVRSIVLAERSRLRSMRPLADEVIGTFAASEERQSEPETR